MERVARQISGDAKAVIALIAHDCALRFGTEDAVDLSTVITFPRQLLLRSGNGRVGGLIGRIVGVLAVVTGVATLIDARIIAVRRIVIGGVVIVRIAVPRKEPEIEDEPGVVDETATMTVPPMVGVTVPIAMPVAVVAREDVIAPRAEPGITIPI